MATSGQFSDQGLIFAILLVRVDAVLFAVDYIFESNVEGTKWMDAAPINESDKEKVYYLNDKRVFNI